MISVIEEHPVGGIGSLEVQEDMTIVAIVFRELYVDEKMPTGIERKLWVRRDSRPAGFALLVDGNWYEFARTISR